MGKLVRLTEERRRRSDPVCFTRAEINQLLALYSRRVGRGEWRDYAIRLSPGMAAFTVFKSAMERPLYTIAKFRPGSLGPGGDFLVSQGPQRLMQAQRIEEVVTRLDHRLKLVQG
ncbi:MAG: DUF2794 domain-containing protein [Alphaproteobacteria bacterium]|jgi:hypothetical protein|nr:DUF2794 domain-containing protein [Alphaproteobacteria bacterium]